MAADPLETWMREKGVWLKDLHTCLTQLGVITLEDFQALSPKTFQKVLKEARLMGLMADKPGRLKAAYKGTEYRPKFSKSASANPPLSSKKRKRASSDTSYTPTFSSDDTLGTLSPITPSESSVRIGSASEAEVYKVMQPFLVEARCWTMDTFKEMYARGIHTPESFQSLDSTEFEDLLKHVRLRGLTGKKVNYFRGLWRGFTADEVDRAAAEYKAKKALRKASSTSGIDSTVFSPRIFPATPRRPRPKKSADELKEDARNELDPWLRKHNVWMYDMVDVLIEHDVYCIRDFKSLSRTEFHALFDAAKRRGLIGDQPKILKALYYKTKIPERARERESKPSLTHLALDAVAAASIRKDGTSDDIPERDVEDSAVMEVNKEEVRSRMEPYMRKKNYWQLDLFLALFDAGIHSPTDLSRVTYGELTEIIREAKLKGFMGRGPVNLEEDWRRRSSKKKKKKKKTMKSPRKIRSASATTVRG